MRTKFCLILSLLCAPLVFWACDGDSTSANDKDPLEESSSSSDVILSGGSAEVEGSSCSSGAKNASSSSESVRSSSSVNASPLGKPNWAYLNPEIDYGEMTDARDGQVYKTVKIGNQVWMAENLNYDYNKGSARSYCYDNEASNCEKYGRLYTWSAAVDSVALANDVDDPNFCGVSTADNDRCRRLLASTLSEKGPIQGVCPKGWHLPTKWEWQTLIKYIGAIGSGLALRATSGWEDNYKGTDDYGFSALAAGYERQGEFFNTGNLSHFWSCSKVSHVAASSMTLFRDNASAGDGGDAMVDGYSVRCLKD